MKFGWRNNLMKTITKYPRVIFQDSTHRTIAYNILGGYLIIREYCKIGYYEEIGRVFLNKNTLKSLYELSGTIEGD